MGEERRAEILVIGSQHKRHRTFHITPVDPWLSAILHIQHYLTWVHDCSVLGCVAVLLKYRIAGGNESCSTEKYRLLLWILDAYDVALHAGISPCSNIIGSQ